jgi:hypothetical protein
LFQDHFVGAENDFAQAAVMRSRSLGRISSPTNNSRCRLAASGIRNFTPAITIQDRKTAATGSICVSAASSRKTQMKIVIQRLNGLWHLIVGSCRIRTPFLETQDRALVVRYARRAYPGARIFQRD